MAGRVQILALRCPKSLARSSRLFLVSMMKLCICRSATTLSMKYVSVLWSFTHMRICYLDKKCKCVPSQQSVTTSLTITLLKSWGWRKAKGSSGPRTKKWGVLLCSFVWLLRVSTDLWSRSPMLPPNVETFPLSDSYVHCFLINALILSEGCWLSWIGSGSEGPVPVVFSGVPSLTCYSEDTERLVVSAPAISLSLI